MFLTVKELPEKEETKKMKQLGNMAIVCAQRPEILMMVANGAVTVCVGSGPERNALTAKCNDDAEISRIITNLNFGEYAPNRAYSPAFREAV